jgi:hypothetical protein
VGINSYNHELILIHPNSNNQEKSYASADLLYGSEGVSFDEKNSKFILSGNKLDRDASRNYVFF